MIIFCEECGERYIIEQNKIKEKVIIFNCRICKYLVKVITPDVDAMNPADGKATKS